MSVVAFIPARGGSKGIPRKNLSPLAGKPLIQYTVEAALGAKEIEGIFLSSDDKEIIQFCDSVGLKTEYQRPAELASDHATTIDALIHGLDWIKAKNGAYPETVVLLQPTSPLRTSTHIDEAIRQYKHSGKNTLISVHEMIEHPYECILSKAGAWSYLSKPDQKVTRRQDYKDLFYYINGAIYIVKTEFLLKKKSLFEEGETELYIMNQEFGVDIDTIFDLKRAEFTMVNIQ